MTNGDCIRNMSNEVTGPELLESTKRLLLYVNESIINCRPVSPRIYDYARSLAVCISPLLVKDLYLAMEDQEREIGRVLPPRPRPRMARS